MVERSIQRDGVRLHVSDDGEGTPVLLIHGFPDSGALWRHQSPALRGAGYRTVAPDLRGFGRSDRPTSVEAYALDRVVADLVAVLDDLRIDRAHVVGHDWGAVCAWLLAASEPGRVRSLVAMSVGHPAAASRSGIDQREKSWYMLLFLFAEAEEMLRADDWRLLRDLVRHHPELERWIPALTPDGALTAALGLYRANAPVTAWRGGSSRLPAVTVPTLGVWSSGDAYLTEAPMTASAEFVKAPWRYERVEGASHWLMLDRPDVVNRLLVEYLGSTP